MSMRDACAGAAMAMAHSAAKAVAVAVAARNFLMIQSDGTSKPERPVILAAIPSRDNPSHGALIL
jgi:hypothetical protein